ncbi:F0-ATPase subunit [Schizosaccharomyces octosporus yFS286]|uniref:ATP synthase subunit 4 n=1 Tax=Schizosaccharomyces octosporus (strain yFS286) TaxID=483514 RepID=S9QY32_SCHOY|nr:F0-ATPase subunit [Schizosaccharomyces octosporus yFS286]EPX71200.1 F0-ATPase subunit [Schizosaccharomyces octosporus yFS286]
MASRLFLQRTLPAFQKAAFMRTAAPFSRSFSYTPRNLNNSEPPKRTPADQKAAQLINAAPSTSLLTKSGVLTVTAAALATAISKGIYVVNEETIVVASFLGLLGVFGTLGRKAYNEWSEKTINNIANILETSREGHKDAIQERIQQVSGLQDVEEITKVLFNTSKDTARMEAEIFELEQQVALTHQAKSVLDSWVNHEASIRADQQKRLVSEVLSRVDSKVSTQKFQQEALNESVAEVEKVLATA